MPPGLPSPTGPPKATRLVTMNNQNNKKRDEDEKAKAKPRKAASRPGVVAVSGEEASRLDQRIAEKRGGDVKPPPEAVNQLQQDVHAKQRKAPPASQPGAVRAHLDSLEDQVAAKTAGGLKKPPPSSLKPAPAALTSLEDRISAKMAMNDRKPAAVEEDRKPAAVDSTKMGEDALQGLEAAVASKTDRKYPAGGEKEKEKETEVKKLSPPTKKVTSPDTAKMPKEDEGGRGLGLLDDADLEYGVYDAADNPDGLAVAVPVPEEDENVFIPSAVEYDPDAKPPVHQSKRFRMYAFLALFLLVLVGVGAGVGIPLAKNKREDDQPVNYRETLGIREFVERVIGTEVLDDESSPSFKALRWITFNDPLQLLPQNPVFLQRFLLADFYFSTSMERPWDSCNPPNLEEGEDDKCVYGKLESLTPTVQRTPRAGSVRWVSGQHECEWVGVTCDEENQVRDVDLTGVNMTGTVPASLVHLPLLSSLSMGYGDLKGTLPQGISKLQHLINFETHYNQISGKIPSDLLSNINIQRLNLAGNLLTGSIPGEIKGMKDLKGLFLFENLFTGTIPPEIAELKSLSFVRFHRNRMTGTIPPNLLNSNNIVVVWFNDNDLTGTLPSELGKSRTLADFRVHNNPKLGGTIPKSLYHPNIYRYDLFNCNFTGPLDPALITMTDLVTFRIQDNAFTGQIPDGLEVLTSLNTFQVFGNQFNGSVPEELCTLRDTSRLQFLEADCLATGDSDPEIFCPEGCCTKCCDEDAAVCEDIP